MGLYALTLMEREGPLHGYGLSERIAERTEGAWRPGAGSVYPSLRKLVESGLARSKATERRRVYSITPQGRALLRRMRRANGPGDRTRPDLSALWAEVFGSANVQAFLLRRFRRSMEALELQVSRSIEAGGDPKALRRTVLAELDAAAARLRAPDAASRQGLRARTKVTDGH